VDGPAEVAAQDIAEEDAVLHGQRPVEAQVAPHPHDLARRRVGRQEQRHGITAQAHHDEDHGGDQPERDQRAEEPVGEKGQESAHG
jgi:hypothetical protein